MFDASSKLQPGILLGNLVEFGSFKQCIDVQSEVHGKHCLIKITPTLKLIKKILSFRNVSEKRFPKIRLIVEKSALFWAVCAPKSCPSEDILKHFSKNILSLGEGLNLSVSLAEKSCVSSGDEAELGLLQYCVM